MDEGGNVQHGNPSLIACESSLGTKNEARRPTASQYASRNGSRDNAVDA